MNIHLPAILGFTRYQGFDPSPYFVLVSELKGAVGASAKTLAAPLASAAGGGGKPIPQPGVMETLGSDVLINGIIGI
jgi:hypothetical protein